MGVATKDDKPLVGIGPKATRIVVTPSKQNSITATNHCDLAIEATIDLANPS